MRDGSAEQCLDVGLNLLRRDVGLVTARWFAVTSPTSRLRRFSPTSRHCSADPSRIQVARRAMPPGGPPATAATAPAPTGSPLPEASPAPSSPGTPPDARRAGLHPCPRGCTV